MQLTKIVATMVAFLILSPSVVFAQAVSGSNPGGGTSTASGVTSVNNKTGSAITLSNDDLAPGTATGMEVIGQGSGSPVVPATMPTYYSGWIAPTSGTPSCLIQLPSSNLTAGFFTVSACAPVTYPNASGGTTTINVAQLKSTVLAGDPTYLAFTNAANTFAVPTGCTGNSVYFAFAGMQGLCNGNIYQNGYIEFRNGAANTVKQYGVVHQQWSFDTYPTSFLGITVSGGPAILPFLTPATSSAACAVGQVENDASYYYVCTATNHWMRAALATF